MLQVQKDELWDNFYAFWDQPVLVILMPCLSKVIRLATSADENHEGGPLLPFVNGAWLDQRLTLKSSFQEIVNGSYKAQLTTVDFKNKVCIDIVVSNVNYNFSL